MHPWTKVTLLAILGFNTAAGNHREFYSFPKDDLVQHTQINSLAYHETLQ
jgi:hypothetical protein